MSPLYDSGHVIIHSENIPKIYNNEGLFSVCLNFLKDIRVDLAKYEALAVLFLFY
jgi:hypothetical protein